MSSKSIAVIGAGVSGLSCAAYLKARGFQVDVFEKSRGLGGRLSVRRVDQIGSFDLGAQFYTVRSREFAQVHEDVLAAGLVRLWQGDLWQLQQQQKVLAYDRPRFVAPGGMNKLAHHLSSGLKVNFQTKATHLQRDALQVRVAFADGKTSESYHGVVIALPYDQAEALLRTCDIELGAICKIELHPCLAIYVRFAHALSFSGSGFFADDEIVGFAAGMERKWGTSTKDGAENWVIHSSHPFASKDLEPGKAAEECLARFMSLLGEDAALVRKNLLHLGHHRWRYARAPQPEKLGSLLIPGTTIAVCGDWLNSGRVEGAFLSGKHAAERLLHFF